jgi:hypothetical protein
MFQVEFTSERNQKTFRRLAALQEAAGVITFVSKWQEMLMVWMPAHIKSLGSMYGACAWPTPLADVIDGVATKLDALRTSGGEAASLAEHPSFKHSVVLCYFMNMGFSLCCTEQPFWDPNSMGGEVALADACNNWTYETAGKNAMKSVVGFDFVRACLSHHLSPDILHTLTITSLFAVFDGHSPGRIVLCFRQFAAHGPVGSRCY